MNKENRYLKQVQLKADNRVNLLFVESVHLGFDKEAEKEIEGFNEYPVKSKYPVHKDFRDAMNALVPYALELAEIKADSKSEATYDVTGVKLSGEIENRNARLTITLEKSIKRTIKPVIIKTPQTTLFDQTDYEKAAEVVEVMKNVISEAWKYLGGKHPMKEQLSLFNEEVIKSKPSRSKKEKAAEMSVA